MGGVRVHDRASAAGAAALAGCACNPLKCGEWRRHGSTRRWRAARLMHDAEHMARAKMRVWAASHLLFFERVCRRHAALLMCEDERHLLKSEESGRDDLE